MAYYNRKQARRRVHKRIRKSVHGTLERPRLAVHFSGRHVYAQVIDDDAGVTLAAASTIAENSGNETHSNKKSAQRIGREVAQKSKAKNITKVVFDRGGFFYHGKVKALADAAREGGLEF